MAFVNVPNTARVELRQQSGSQQTENVFHAEFEGTITQAHMDALTAAVDTWAHGTMKALEPASWQYREVYARALDTSIDFESVNNAHPGAGTNSGTALPNNVAFCVRLLSGRTGRSARGRWYWGLITGGQAPSDSTMTPTAGGAVVVALRALQTALSAIQWNMVVVSYVQEGVRLTTGLKYGVTTIDFSDLTLDSQRRRLPGRGS